MSVGAQFIARCFSRWFNRAMNCAPTPIALVLLLNEWHDSLGGCGVAEFTSIAGVF